MSVDHLATRDTLTADQERRANLLACLRRGAAGLWLLPAFRREKPLIRRALALLRAEGMRFEGWRGRTEHGPYVAIRRKEV